jgi:hypothetical protein
MIPAVEEFVIEFVDTGGKVDIASQFSSQAGEAPGSVEFSFTGTVFDPKNPSGGVDADIAFVADPDPEIVWFVSLYNFSTSSIRTSSRVFTGTFTEKINEVSTVRSQIEASSSVTDIKNDGVTIAPYNQTHLAVSELFNTTTATNMGVDIGNAFTTTGSGPIPSAVVGWKKSPQGVLSPGEIWHGMRTKVSYSLTPSDAALLVGRTEITTPEPSTLIFFGAGILGLVLYGWHRRRSA